jgi:membrane protein
MLYWISYLIFAILVSIITCLFLFLSLWKNDFISKRAYVIYGLLSVWILFAAAIYKGKEPSYYLFAAVVGALFVSSLFIYQILKYRNKSLYVFLFSLVLAAAQLAAAFLPYSIFCNSGGKRAGDAINWFDAPFPHLTVLYLSLAIGVLLQFAAYLPRRNIHRWMDRAAVVVSATAFAAVVFGLVLCFQCRFAYGSPPTKLNNMIYLLTLAAYVLLLLAGKKPARNLSEPPASAKTERPSPNETEGV